MSKQPELPRIDIGLHRYLNPMHDISGKLIGYVEHHPNAKDGRACAGYITLDTPENTKSNKGKWRVVSEDPLTLEPSVLCSSCGNHGFIQDGQWKPA